MFEHLSIPADSIYMKCRQKKLIKRDSEFFLTMDLILEKIASSFELESFFLSQTRS